MSTYNFSDFEKKWQDKWEETGAFHAGASCGVDAVRCGVSASL